MEVTFEVCIFTSFVSSVLKLRAWSVWPTGKLSKPGRSRPAWAPGHGWDVGVETASHTL